MELRDVDWVDAWTKGGAVVHYQHGRSFGNTYTFPILRVAPWTFMPLLCALRTRMFRYSNVMQPHVEKLV
jgi:hypothetical protein